MTLIESSYQQVYCCYSHDVVGTTHIQGTFFYLTVLNVIYSILSLSLCLVVVFIDTNKNIERSAKNKLVVVVVVVALCNTLLT
jgi:hypothetical protein